MVRKDAEIEWFCTCSADVVDEALGDEDIVHSFDASCIRGLFSVKAVFVTEGIGQSAFRYDTRHFLRFDSNGFIKITH